MKNLIELKGITKSFPTGDGILPVLKDINLSVRRGEFVTIVGSSGSGKSTLMNIIGCLDTPDSGDYLLDGEPVADLSDRRLSAIRNRKIGFVFQGFHLIQCLTAIENVELPLIYRNIGRAKRHQLARDALISVGLEKRMYHRPSEMSGGQQQRVAIARAISTAPPIVMADEPTGNLDTHSSIEIMEMLSQLNKKGTTIILITHDIDTAEYAHRIIELRDGRIIRDHLQEQKAQKEAGQ